MRISAGVRFLGVGIVVVAGLVATALADTAVELQDPQDRTPPRLSLVEGQVSFWRPGAEEWAEAQPNLPLAPGDELATGDGRLEIQVGPAAYVRGAAGSQFGLQNQDSTSLQFKVTAGTVTADLATMEAGQAIELDTPQAALILRRAGSYRVEVHEADTTVTARRGGMVTVVPTNGDAVDLFSNQQTRIDGAVSAVALAPPPDAWDEWNDDRLRTFRQTVSARYVLPGVYGVNDLDQHGTWQTTPAYGPVWTPNDVAADWAPYSTGSWMFDPAYGWTWVDSAPWGWAPYHHGRWVSVNSRWAWAPGPRSVRPVYSPALVVFLDAGLAAGVRPVAWVALGWGEPIVPWWGRGGVGVVASWRGWGGPHVEGVYRNALVGNAVVTVSEGRFGRGPLTTALVTMDPRSVRPLYTPPPVAPLPASFVGTSARGYVPPAAQLGRSVVATRPAVVSRIAGPAGPRWAESRIVPMPQSTRPALRTSAPSALPSPGPASPSPRFALQQQPGPPAPRYAGPTPAPASPTPVPRYAGPAPPPTGRPPAPYGGASPQRYAIHAPPIPPPPRPAAFEGHGQETRSQVQAYSDRGAASRMSAASRPAPPPTPVARPTPRPPVPVVRSAPAPSVRTSVPRASAHRSHR